MRKTNLKLRKLESGSKSSNLSLRPVGLLIPLAMLGLIQSLLEYRLFDIRFVVILELLNLLFRPMINIAQTQSRCVRGIERRTH